MDAERYVIGTSDCVLHRYFPEFYTKREEE